MPWKILIILCCASFTGPFMASSFNLALPNIAMEYSLKAVTLTWFSTGFLITTAIFQIPLAKTADIVGRKKMFLIGLAGMAVITFLTPFAPNGTVLIICRVAMGFCSAMTFATNMAILMSVVPQAHRASALAIMSASVYSALAIGPFVGGLLTEIAGWRSIFYLAAFMVLLVFIFAKIFLKGEWTEAKGEKFDYLGSAIYAVSIVGIIFGFTSLPYAYGIISLVIGVTAFVFFILYEKKVTFPVIDVKMFASNRVFTLACLAALINYSANSATGFMLSLYLQFIRGFEPLMAGVVLLTQAVTQVFASIIAGKISGRFMPSSLATMGMTISVAGLSGLVFITPETSVVYIVFCLIILGLGFGLFSSPNTNVIMSAVEKRHYGQASAATGTARLTGQAFSMGIAGMAISLFMGNNKIVPELYSKFMQSFKTTFIICVMMCLVGIYASLARNRQINRL